MTIKYLVRVHLDNADTKDYKNLHSYMESAGFSRRIKFNNHLYLLPDAEYIIDSNMNIDQIFNSVKMTSERIGRGANILVSSVGDVRGDLKLAD